MSLLQDALRRAQKKAGAGQEPPPAPFPDSPPARPRTRWKALLGLAAVVFLAGAAAVFFLPRPDAPTIAIVPRGTPLPAAPSAPGPAEAHAPAVKETAPSPAAAGGPDGGKGAVVRAARPASRGPRVAPGPMAPLGRGDAAGADLPLDRFNAAAEALNRNDTAEAVRRFREVTAVSPELAEAWNGLGLGLLRMKDLEGADAALSRALALSPRYVPALLNAGLLRLEQGRAEEAAALFARAAELSPGSPAPRVNLAVAQSRLGRIHEAEETLQAALRRFPGDPDLLYQLGTVYERAGDRKAGASAYAAFLAASAGSRPDLEGRVRERLRSWEPGSRLDSGSPATPQ